MAKQATQTWMWAEACALIDEAERRHRRFFDLLSTPSSTPAWEPPVNVFSADGELLIVVALPGADAEHVTITILADGVQIDAHVPPPQLAYRMGIERLEVPYGDMRRRLTLPPGRYTLAERRLVHGCLHLRLTEERR
jgi:HSP20 family molecular chaperone IbpA